MIKYKIVLPGKVIEFATEAEALAYKAANNLTEDVESFEEEVVTSAPIVPDSVTPRQMRVALVLSGISLESIEVMINALSEPDRSVAKITWEYSVEFQRNNPILNTLAPALGLTQEDIDQLFVMAQSL